MSLAKRLLLLLLVLVLTGAALVCLSPIMVTDGIRLYALWKARTQGVKIEFGQIESPLLRPVVIHRLRITTVRPCSFNVALTARRVEVDLNLRALLFRTRARVVHTLTIDGMRGHATRVATDAETDCHFDWPMLRDLIADELRVTDFDFQVENSATQFAVRGVDLTASQIEAGRFAAEEIRVSTPWFRQQFLNLRGATAWENNRLTIGALSLARGLDVETITTDLSHLEKKSIGFEVKLDAFGGKLRASVASENRARKVLWNVAGTAADISLAQMSAALGLHDPATGSVRASKFTFRGDTQNLARATASVWAEVNGFTWRDRSAEVIMIGASLYNRRIDISQFYVKQRENQFTLNGEYLLPEKSAGWLNPNFRADISASITDLGQFARLFGAPEDRFSGSLSIVGTLNGRDRNIGGHLAVEGASLELFGAPADVLKAQLSLKGSVLAFDQLQVRRGENVAAGHGRIDLAHQHDYSGTLAAEKAQLADYRSLLPAKWRELQPDGDLAFHWQGHGKAQAHSGEFQIDGANVQLDPRLALRPISLHVAGNYSPGKTSLTELRLTNAKATLTTAAVIARNSLQLSSLRFDLNGQPKLQGNVYLPFSWGKWRDGRGLWDAFDAGGKFDVSLKLEPTDLHELAGALYTSNATTGRLDAQLTTSGTLADLQARAELHLSDFSQNKTSRLSADATVTTNSGALTADASLVAGNSSPMILRATIPLQRPEAHNVVALDKPFSATLDFPAVLLAQLPPFLTHGIFRDGLVSGRISASQSLRHPSFNGDLQIIGAKLAKSPGPLAGFGGRVEFNGHRAVIPFAELEFSGGRLPWHGAVEFENLSDFHASIDADAAVVELSDFRSEQCISGLNVFSLKQTQHFPGVREIELRRNAKDQWTITLHKNPENTELTPAPSDLEQTFPLCAKDGKVLQFGVAPSPKNELGRDALSILDGKLPPPNQPLP